MHIVTEMVADLYSMETSFYFLLKYLGICFNDGLIIFS